jgi:hypothetical protein
LMASTHLLPHGSASLLLRVPDTHTTRALRLGSSPDSDAAMQDIAMLFTTSCMELRIPRPWILESTATRPPAPLSVADQLTASADSANESLRRLARDLARLAGHQLTIDLFASSSTSQCSRFYSFHPEPASAGVDALAQDSWASSHCPWCQAHSPEFCLLFPPFPLIRGDSARHSSKPGRTRHTTSPSYPAPIRPHGGPPLWPPPAPSPAPSNTTSAFPPTTA